MGRLNTYFEDARVQLIRPPFPLLTRFQRFVCSGGERGVQVSLFAVFVGSVRKPRVNKPALLLFCLRLHLHKGAATREGTLRRAPGSWATLFVLDSRELKDTDESLTVEEKKGEGGSSLVPVDCVLPVDVRSGSLTSLETPAVIISTPSLSPLASGSICL